MRQRGKSSPTPRATSSNLGPPSRPPPTPGSQLPRFSSRREEREGERQGCAWLLLPLSPLRAPSLPDRKPAPIPSQLQLCPPPLPAGPQSHTPLSPGPTAPPRLLPDGPQKAGPIPGAGRPHPPLTGPSSWSPGLAPPAPTLAPRCVAGAGPDGGSLPQIRWLLSQRRPGTLGHGYERAFVLGSLWGKGQKPGLESRQGGGKKAPSLNPFQAQQGRRADHGDSLRVCLLRGQTRPLSPSSAPHLSALLGSYRWGSDLGNV